MNGRTDASSSVFKAASDGNPVDAVAVGGGGGDNTFVIQSGGGRMEGRKNSDLNLVIAARLQARTD